VAANQEKTTSKISGINIRNHDAFTGLLVSVFLFFGFIGIVNHEMWLDELQAWLIARDSSSLLELFKNLRYEGHPGLWHVGLYLISRFTHNPAFMQFFHLIIATSSIYIFAKFAPFTRIQKVVVSFGYFTFYEYNIISRNYAMGVLLIFCFCAFFHTRTKSYFLLSGFLFFLANTNVYGAIISISLGLMLILEYLLSKKLMLSATERRRELLISSFIFCCGIVISAVQMVPPSDASFAAGWKTSFEIKRFAEVLLKIGESYVPIPNVFTYKFWGISIFTAGELSTTFGKVATGLGLVVSAGLLVFSLLLFSRIPVVFFLYTTGTFGMLFFMYIKHPGEIRHSGYLFVLFITCLWLLNYYIQLKRSIYSSRRLSLVFYKSTRILRTLSNFAFRYRNKLIMAILYTHIAAGVFMFTMDLHNPFSLSKEVAKFIKENQIEDKLIVGDIDYVNYIGPPLSGYLDQKIYYVGGQRSGWGSFTIWDEKRGYKNRQQVYNFFEEIDRVAKGRNTNLFLVLNYQLGSCQPGEGNRVMPRGDIKFQSYCFNFPNLCISEISKFTEGIVPDEGKVYYLYRIQHKQNC
jgi:hypothetical protein